ncbi:unnamed protein product [Polarella glacialis]|uniref:Uncharacterized protein n=1 Tax=Polarella glacialis TaxID=89957 RepID=A0A813D4E5_POLGL|nr:unnamed protein product [Polarella glacialis]CAE8690246.1 unnamed protein product [Polarella glacialis]
MAAGTSSDEDEDVSDGGNASDWEDEHWDNIEKESMRALDAQLASLGQGPGESGPGDKVRTPSSKVRAKGGSKVVASASSSSHAVASEQDLVSAPVSPAVHSPSPGESSASNRGPALQDFLPGPPPARERDELSEDARRLKETCILDPYRPEDHVLTSEEMWGGLSSGDEGEEGDDERKVTQAEQEAAQAEQEAAQESYRSTYRSTLDSGTRHPGSSAGAVDASDMSNAWSSSAWNVPSEPREGLSCGIVGAETSLGTIRSAQKEPPLRVPCPRPADFYLDPLVDAGKLLEEACAREPYRQEDHFLTAAEMWGGSSGSDSGRQQQPLGSSPQNRAQQAWVAEDQPLTAEEMWGGVSDDEAENAPAQSSHLSAPADHGVSRQTGLAANSVSRSKAERLHRILAGHRAATELADLNFEELSAVADDCLRAVDTLRWVLDRQRGLAVRSETNGLSAP